MAGDRGFRIVESLDGANELLAIPWVGCIEVERAGVTQVALSDEVRQAQTSAWVVAGDVDHQAEVGAHHVVARLLVALLDAVGDHSARDVLGQSRRRDGAERYTPALAERVDAEGPDMIEKTVTIDGAYVTRMLAEIVKNEDLSRYIL